MHVCLSMPVQLTFHIVPQVNSIGERDTPASLSQGANDLLRDAGQSASSFIVAGSTGTDRGKQSSQILTLLSGSKSKKVPSSTRNAATQGGGKAKTLFEKFKNSKIVGKLGGVMGKMQLKAPIHLIDSMITYAIGVISGMQDMAQVRFFVLFVFFIV
jgi:hypothetical protein